MDTRLHEKTVLSLVEMNFSDYESCVQMEMRRNGEVAESNPAPAQMQSGKAAVLQVQCLTHTARRCKCGRLVSESENTAVTGLPFFSMYLLFFILGDVLFPVFFLW